MHARVDQLLSLRDGEPVDAAARTHVESCADCGAELARLERMRDRLRALPLAATAPGGWRAVQSRLAERAHESRRRALVARIAAVASLATLAVFAGLAIEGRPAPSPTTVQVAADGAPEVGLTVGALQDRSRALEAVLARMPARPAVERADVSMPIDTLEAQVQWLDHQLSQSADESAGSRDAERLWRERVEVMSSLVQLRYVEAQRVSL